MNKNSVVITTPNPGIILYARKHPKYREILNKADLSFAGRFGTALGFAS